MAWQIVPSWSVPERLAADALDEVRRAEQHRLGKQAKQLKGMRYPLLKHPARLKPGEERRLAALRRQRVVDARLARGHHAGAGVAQAACT